MLPPHPLSIFALNAAVISNVTAAELIVPDIIDVRRHMDASARGLGRELFNRIRDAGQRLDHSQETLRRGLTHKIDNYRRGLVHIIAALQARSPARELLLRRNRFGDLHRRFAELPPRALENARHRFQRIEGILRVLGPDATLRRGYSITRNGRGELIRSVTAVRPKMNIRTRVTDGEFESTTN
jgi:exodeoxyribonuclease VII large subunit